MIGFWNAIGAIGGLIGGIGSLFGRRSDPTKQAKELAAQRLTLDKDFAAFNQALEFEKMQRALELREQESQANFGRQFRLNDQTANWQRLINQDTEGARTQRNTDQLNTQQRLQSNQINQENFAARRAIGLASRRLGG
jgi:hypothetical protein